MVEEEFRLWGLFFSGGGGEGGRRMGAADRHTDTQTENERSGGGTGRGCSGWLAGWQAGRHRRCELNQLFAMKKTFRTIWDPPDHRCDGLSPRPSPVLLACKGANWGASSPVRLRPQRLICR